ncbi:DUF397 domain-containing protein [Streptomyces sp. SID11233]|nr:DUF397 domain-containing protein [Streptomyces sp. SID11233]
MTKYDATVVTWVKSSYSNGNGGNCVEIGFGFPGSVVPVRDSKVAGGPVLTVGAAQFSAFLESVAASR